MPPLSYHHTKYSSDRDLGYGHKKRKHASEPRTDRSKRNFSDNTLNALRDLSQPMERENSRNDFSFLARIEPQSRNQYRKDNTPDYDAITGYVEEPMTYQHRITGVERDKSSAQASGPSIILDGQRQHQ